MRSKLTWLVTVLSVAVLLAVATTSASYGVGFSSRGSIGGSGPRMTHSGRTLSGGSQVHRGFTGFSSRSGSFRSFRQDSFGSRRFHDRDSGVRRFHRDTRSSLFFGNRNFFFGFGSPFYYRPYSYYRPYYYPYGYSYPYSYYTPNYYSYDYPSYGKYTTPLGSGITARWVDRYSLEVSWDENRDLERLDYSILDSYKREIRHTEVYSGPFVASLAVPNGAAYIHVRAIGHGGLVLADITSPLTGR